MGVCDEASGQQDSATGWLGRRRGERCLGGLLDLSCWHSLRDRNLLLRTLEEDEAWGLCRSTPRYERTTVSL